MVHTMVYTSFYIYTLLYTGSVLCLAATVMSPHLEGVCMHQH
jgi:hypothetical protein